MARSGGRIEVTVLGHRYPIRIGTGQRDRARVEEAAALLSARIADIERGTGEVDARHLAVMAALALADELLAARDDRERREADDSAFRTAVRERTEKLLGLVDEELAERIAAAS